MPQDKEVKKLIINQLTKEQYNNIETKSDTELYVITDDLHLTNVELTELLNTKQDKLIAEGRISISDTNIITVDLTGYYTSNDVDGLLEDKSNLEETGYELEYTDNNLSLKNILGDILSTVTIKSAPDVDNRTITFNDNGELQTVGELTLDGTYKNTWIGTSEQYESDVAGGLITENTECIVLDDENELITATDINIPTKLSELANDTNFVNQDSLNTLEANLSEQISLKANDDNVVHKDGNETVDGLKIFTQNLTVGNNTNTAKISHKSTGISQADDAFIELGANTLKYTTASETGGIANVESDIFHSGNLIAGNNTTINKVDDKYVIDSTGALSEVNWGNITGDINNQTDLSNKLNNKPDKATTLEGYGIENAYTRDETDSFLNDKLNKTQITNCILEAPHMVDLEFNSGTLTLKAGSKVIVPYGTKVPTMAIGDALNGGTIVDISWDGDTNLENPKLFYIVQYSQNITRTNTSSSENNAAWVIKNPNQTGVYSLNIVSSGETQPTNSDWLWYDTKNNIIKDVNGIDYISFPVSIVSRANEVITNILQTFQHMGYIGSTVWEMKGVKGLAPNGRNEDLTINNIEDITSTINTLTITSAWGTGVELLFNGLHYNRAVAAVFEQETPPNTSSNMAYWYNPSRIIWKETTNSGATWISFTSFPVATMEFSNGVINSIDVKYPFQALDSNKTDFIAHQAMPSNKFTQLTIGASNSKYTAPADGYFCAYGRSTANSGQLWLNGPNLFRSRINCNSGYDGAVYIPAKKGDIVTLTYAEFTVNDLRFFYAEGAQ